MRQHNVQMAKSHISSQSHTSPTLYVYESWPTVQPHPLTILALKADRALRCRKALLLQLLPIKVWMLILTSMDAFTISKTYTSCPAVPIPGVKMWSSPKGCRQQLKLPCGSPTSDSSSIRRASAFWTTSLGWFKRLQKIVQGSNRITLKWSFKWTFKINSNQRRGARNRGPSPLAQNLKKLLNKIRFLRQQKFSKYLWTDYQTRRLTNHNRKVRSVKVLKE